jgi:AraC-like DNA-binding protein
MPGSAQRIAFATTDPEVGAESMRVLLGAAPRIGRVEEEFEIRMEAVIGGRVSTASMSLLADVPATGESPSTHIMILPRAGRYEVLGRGGASAEPGEAILLEGGQEHQAMSRHAEFDVVTIDASLMSDVVARSAGRRARRPQPGALDPALARHLAQTAEWFSTSVLGDDDVYASDILRTHGEMAVVIASAAAFGWVGDDDAHAEHAGSRSLRLALVFIEEHAGEPITIADIAEAARLSPRGLQGLFRRSLNTTPAAELRRVRLNAVHRALTTSEPGTRTVEQIARHWGFAHLGRFAAAYRAEFGVLPSEALRR